ncbi:Putative disease resistance RPP13-like protein 1 [Linum perenne]
MAHGYLGSSGATQAIGESYFEDLSRRCLFQVECTICRMHDLVHDFAQFISRGECGNMEILVLERHHDEAHDQLGSYGLSIDELRHLMVSRVESGDIPLIFNNFKGMQQLRSLLVAMSFNCDEIIHKSTFKLICLRSLELKNCYLKAIPPSIRKLIHLRMLSFLRLIGLNELPEELCELHNLQTLRLEGCVIAKWPSQIEKLVNLRHLLNGGNIHPIPKRHWKVARPKSFINLGSET